jgi:putative ABC transport system ATP-binding protein
MLRRAWRQPAGPPEALDRPPLEAVDLVRTFLQGENEVRAVDGISLTVGAGELVAIMGPSGSGKSTLLHLLGGLDSPQKGEVLLEGERISTMPERELSLVRRRRLGFLLQFFSLLPTLSAAENVAFPLLMDGVADATDRARAALGEVGLGDRADHRPAQLSGGEQQRVALARALVSEPAVILADEPTGSLDSVGGAEILTLLRQASEAGQAVVMVTHDERAGSHSNRILEIRDGRLVGEQLGSTGGAVLETESS